MQQYHNTNLPQYQNTTIPQYQDTMIKRLHQEHYYELVYEVTRQIPRGRVTNYGAIANYLQLGSSRMIGWALNQLNGHEGDVPAHRVVNRKGELSGRHHWNPPSRMAELLENEGVIIENDCVRDFKTLFWSPEEIAE